MEDYQKKAAGENAYCAESHPFFEDGIFLRTPAVSVAAFTADQLQTRHWRRSWGLDVWAEFSTSTGRRIRQKDYCGCTQQASPFGLQIVGRRRDFGVCCKCGRIREPARTWAFGASAIA